MRGPFTYTEVYFHSSGYRAQFSTLRACLIFFKSPSLRWLMNDALSEVIHHRRQRGNCKDTAIHHKGNTPPSPAATTTPSRGLPSIRLSSSLNLLRLKLLRVAFAGRHDNAGDDSRLSKFSHLRPHQTAELPISHLPQQSPRKSDRHSKPRSTLHLHDFARTAPSIPSVTRLAHTPPLDCHRSWTKSNFNPLGTYSCSF